MEIDASLRSVILDAIACGVAVLDSDGRILVWNQWMVRHSGLPDDIAIGRKFVELFPETTGTRLGQAIGTALSHRLAGIVSPSIHKPPLPLYRNTMARERNERLQQLIHVSPIRLSGMPACTIQVQDVTAAINRENLLRDQSTDLAARNLQLQAQIDEIQALQAEIVLRDTRDPLTGVLNRKKLEARLQGALAAALPFALLLVVPDDLKQIILERGADTGDAVLVALVGLMRQSLPGTAVLGRYDTAEFLILLPNHSIDQAEALATTWRSPLAGPEPAGSPSRPMSFSVGIAGFPQHGQDKNTLIQCLELSLFIAKQEGGDRIIRYDQVGLL